MIFDAGTGGAHCCYYAFVYRYSPAENRYRRVRHNFADPAYRLVDEDGDGSVEFRSADARFAYEFTAFAFSKFPVQVWLGAGRGR